MDRPGDSQKPNDEPAPSEEQPKIVDPTYRSLYLIFYNFVSAILWSAVLGRVLLIWMIHGTPYVYDGVGSFTKWTQTLAGLEVLHSVLGMFHYPK